MELGKLSITLTADAKNLKNGVDDSKKSLKDLGESGKREGRNIEESFSKMNSAANKMGGVMAGAVAGLSGLAESTIELRQNQGKLNTAFEAAGSSAEVASGVYDDLFRVLGDDDVSVEAANHLAKLTTNQKDLSEWTDICQGVYATFGDSLPIEGLTESANETAKVGKVTGSLADALNWAGISEDDFNTKLAKCNTEAEREKLIRETLIGKYQKASSLYEKNAKDVLKANEAQNKLNKSMAEIGKEFQPALTAIKNLGATVLSDMKEPVREATDVLINTLIPAVEKVSGFIGNHADLVAGAIKPMLVAMGGIKAVAAANEGATKLLGTSLFDLATKTKDAGAESKKFGGVLGNMFEIAAAHPYAAVAIGIGGATTALLALGDAVDDYVIKQSFVSEAGQELIDTAQRESDALNNQIDAYNNNATAIDSNMTHTQDLATELMNLADSNGKVKDSDKARAQFILGELNGALGTEYQMTGNVINNYGKLKNKIYEVIEAKKTSMLLESHESTYVKAVEGEKNSLNGLKTSLKDLEGAHKEYKNSTQSSWNGLKDEQYKVYQQKQETYRKYVQNYVTGQLEIRRHEAASVEAMRGNYSKAEAILNGTDTAWEKSALAAITAEAKKKGAIDDSAKIIIDKNGKIKVAINETARAMAEGAKKGKDGFEKNSKGVGKTAVDEAKKNARLIKSQFEKNMGDSGAGGKRKFGANVKGYTTGAVNESKTGSNLVKNSTVSGMATAGTLSKSSFTRNNKGFSNSAVNEADTMKTKLKRSTSFNWSLPHLKLPHLSVTGKFSIKPPSVPNFSISWYAKGGVFDAPTLFNYGNGMLGGLGEAGAEAVVPLENNTQWLDKIATMLNEKQGNNSRPIVLQVDGKTFAQISVDSINELTRQRGSLPLRLV